ncbi:ABC transporter ATP-binding protein [Mycena kentingensis (nom. inval.)]|nr:ABC transporter ATP-binding protein [Mycena kentingensis (nom. inval.)]
MTVEGKSKKKPGSTKLQEVRLGVWRIVIEKPTSSRWAISSLSLPDVAEQWKKATSMLPQLQTFAMDIYALDPFQATLFLLSRLWHGFEEIFVLHLSTRILAIIEIGLKSSKPDTSAILQAVAARLVLVGMTTMVDVWSEKISAVMETRVQHYYEDKLFAAKLETDMPATHDNADDGGVYAGGVWDSFTDILGMGTVILQTIGILTYILQLATSTQHGPIFVLLCVAKPLARFLYRQSLWHQPFIAQAENQDFKRLKALGQLGGDKYRQDIISGGVGGYIMDQYQQAHEALGDVNTDYPTNLWDNERSAVSNIIFEVLAELPMFFYAVNAILNPTKFTLSKIAMLQHSEAVLRRSFHRGVNQMNDFQRGMGFVKRLYKVCSPANSIKDGVLPYPSPTMEEAERKGMSIDFRNVSFSYPGAKDGAKALDDVSFSIKSGQLIVLVGANGSGKSTIVKLLARLYDATGGEIRVGDGDIQRYQIADLRRATASLTQDHHLYPLSLGENIALGNAARLSASTVPLGEDPEVLKAAERGGASGFMTKLDKGFETNLNPQVQSYTLHVQEQDGTPLAAEMKKLAKKADISGGERQRVVASRTFMRFTTGKVRLVIADEGSSALDPEAEWELFKNLREEREGKTLIFVTHRFGHLTKYADAIFCMKDGKLVESGTHEHLIAMEGGEYAKLYEIQAKAFNASSDS